MEKDAALRQQEIRLMLYSPTVSPLFIHTIALSPIKQDDQLIDCRLTFQVDLDLYQQIEQERLFNLQPGVRGAFEGTFLPNADITIEASLKPDLLHHLNDHSTDTDAVANYLHTLSQEQPDHPLLQTESWLALSVKQMQEAGEVGYSTFWSYVTPSILAGATEGKPEELAEAIVDFCREWTEANLTSSTQTAFAQLTDGISSFIEQLASADFDQLEATEDTNGPIFQEMQDFFQADEWPVAAVEGEPVLQTAFQGDNGNWTCFAKAREAEEQFAFYSVCPVNVPDDRRSLMAEFLTKANYGLLIGNFEMDFTDGEIRYKTSIDVRNDCLSHALIKQLVYTNVATMDRYLPGIMSVIYGQHSPTVSIAQVEG